MPAAGAAAAVALMLTGGSAAAAAPHWTLVSSPDANSTQDNDLGAVSCSGATFCMAVGDYGDSTTGHFQSLAEKWNGHIWALVGTPDTSKDLYELSGVSCRSATFCMAVGFYANGTGRYRTLTEKWNGTSWAKVSSPDPSTQYDVLNGVSCSSPAFCMAAGEATGSSGAGQTLTEKWNGTSWAKVSSPDTSTSETNVLTAVSCPSPAFCMAAGYAGTSSESTRALTEKWNGTSWAKVSLAALSTPEDELEGVSCSSGAFCLTVGYYFKTGHTPARALIEKWNGSSWALVSSPDTSGKYLYYLPGVSCSSAKFCIAAGDYTPSSASVLQQTLTLKWNGTKLAKVNSADSSSTQTNTLDGVSCPSATFCMAAGEYFSAADFWQTLTEMW